MEPLNSRYERKRISLMCFGVVLLILTSLASGYLFTILAGSAAPSLAGSLEFGSWIMAIGQYAVGFPICLLVIGKIPADRMEKRKLPVTALPKLFIVCCAMMIAGSLLGYFANSLIAMLLGRTPGDLTSIMVNKLSPVYNIVIIAIIGPIWEEMIFRKALIDRLNRLGDRPAILLSALLFGLLHGNFYQFFYAFLVGLVLGYLYVRTGKISHTIIFHILLNLMFSVVPDLLNRSIGMPAATAWQVVEIVLAVLGALLFLGEVRNIRLMRGWIDLPRFRWGSLAFVNFGMLVLLLLSAGVFAVNIVF